MQVMASVSSYLASSDMVWIGSGGSEGHYTRLQETLAPLPCTMHHETAVCILYGHHWYMSCASMTLGRQ